MANIIGTRKAKLFMGASPTEVTDAVSKITLSSKEATSDFTSFADAAGGGAREYSLSLTMVQDTATGSLWDYIWSSAGTDVAFQFWPNGQNSTSPTTPTATYPKYSGTVTITEPDGDFLGGEANKSSTARFTVDVEWTCLAKPTKAIA